MSRANRPLLTLACLVSLTACNSESNPTAPENTQVFTRAELNSAVGAIGGTAFNISSLESSQTLPCPLGGSVQVTPISDTFTKDGNGSAVVQLAHNNCRAVDDEGREWTVSGRPSLRLSISAKEAATDAVEIQMAMRGNVRFSTDNRSGDCAMDVLFVIGFQFAESLSATLRVKGSVCGQPIDETRPFSFE